MRENTGKWSSSVKRNIEVAFCVTGLGDSECYYMLLEDPIFLWVWNAVKELSSSTIPSVRRMAISLFYRFEKHVDLIPIMMWILRKDQDFICRYYVALCITKSPLIAFHIYEDDRSEIVRLVFQDEYTQKLNINDQDDLQRKLNNTFARCGYSESMLVENAKINRDY